MGSNSPKCARELELFVHIDKPQDCARSGVGFLCGKADNLVGSS